MPVGRFSFGGFSLRSNLLPPPALPARPAAHHSPLVVQKIDLLGVSRRLEEVAVQSSKFQEIAAPSSRHSRDCSTMPRAPQKAKAGVAAKGRLKASSGGGGAAKKGAKGKHAATSGKGNAEAVVKKTRKPSTVMWRVSDELAAVVGSNEATVDTIRTGVYGYIKEHDLQVFIYVLDQPRGARYACWKCTPGVLEALGGAASVTFGSVFAFCGTCFSASCLWVYRAKEQVLVLLTSRPCV